MRSDKALVAVAVALVLVVAVAAAGGAITQAAHAFTKGDCRPRPGLPLARCTLLTRYCALQGIQMGWVRSGCIDNGNRQQDGGCQVSRCA